MFFAVLLTLLGIGFITILIDNVGVFVMVVLGVFLVLWPLAQLWAVLAGVVSLKTIEESTLTFVAGMDPISHKDCVANAGMSMSLGTAIALLLVIANIVPAFYSAIMLPFAIAWTVTGLIALPISAATGHAEGTMTYTRKAIYFLCTAYGALLIAGLIVRMVNGLHPGIYNGC